MSRDIFAVLLPVWSGIHGARLKHVRMNIGMTQVELAKALDVTQGYLSMLERGGFDTACIPALTFILVLGEKNAGFIFGESVNR